jgi:prepilin-type N-terminal cleavage/methylation domain-containing protein/prepilin-type processing-associated H-X9-DG protein
MKALSKNRISVFTLIELLVVISIIAILASLMLPALNKARNSAYCAQCTSNQKQIQYAFSFYTGNNDDWLPPYYDPKAYSAGQLNFWSQYLVAEIQKVNSLADAQRILSGKNWPKYWLCPNNKTANMTINSMAYGANAYLMDKRLTGAYGPCLFKVTTLARPSQLILFGCSDGDNNYDSIISAGWYVVSENHNGGANLGYVDGHVTRKHRKDVSRAGAAPLSNGSGGWTTELQKMWGYWAYSRK